VTRRFDSLVHVTEDGRWRNGRSDASWSRLLSELDRAQIARACLVGLAGAIGNAFVLDRARAAGGRLVPVAGVDPSQYRDAATLSRELAALANSGFEAVKLHPRLNGFDPLDSRCADAINEASRRGLVVFLDTLFRQRGRATSNAADVVDRLATACPDARIVLLHSGGPAILEVSQVARLHDGLLLDLSFTLVRYAGSSLDADISWLMRDLDQRLVVGSDMPEITPTAAFERAEQLAQGLPEEKRTNIFHANLARLFRPAPAASAV
jgi:predicted TIM-barrel fold metal-dependent hydrolase